MTRKLPRAYFWIDQELLRRGLWTKLSPSARLAYVAIAATCDREGLSIWSRNKLMELAGVADPDGWQSLLDELHKNSLVDVQADHVPPAVKLLPMQSGPSPDGASVAKARSRELGVPIVIHTHTSIQFNGNRTEHVEP